MWQKNPIYSYSGQNSEMPNCQDYTDHSVAAEELFNISKISWTHGILELKENRMNNAILKVDNVLERLKHKYVV